MIEEDYYTLLNVSSNADDQTIKKAYRKASLLLHPDRHQASDTSSFARIQMAYHVLSNAHLRAVYDKSGVRGVQIASQITIPPSMHQRQFSNLVEFIDQSQFHWSHNQIYSMALDCAHSFDLIGSAAAASNIINRLPIIDTVAMASMHQRHLFPSPASSSALLGKLHQLRSFVKFNLGCRRSNGASSVAFGLTDPIYGPVLECSLGCRQHIFISQFYHPTSQSTLWLNSKFPIEGGQWQSLIHSIQLRWQPQLWNSYIDLAMQMQDWTISPSTTLSTTWKRLSTTCTLQTEPSMTLNSSLKISNHISIISSIDTNPDNQQISVGLQQSFDQKYAIFSAIQFDVETAFNYGVGFKLTFFTNSTPIWMHDTNLSFDTLPKTAFAIPVRISSHYSWNGILCSIGIPTLMSLTIQFLLHQQWFALSTAPTQKSCLSTADYERLKQRALTEQQAMSSNNAFASKQMQESSVNGLVIDSAIYTGSMDSINVTIPLQMLVDQHQLVIESPSSFANLLGFHPVGESNASLIIKYTFRSISHIAHFHDGQSIHLPHRRDILAATTSN